MLFRFVFVFRSSRSSNQGRGGHRSLQVVFHVFYNLATNISVSVGVPNTSKTSRNPLLWDWDRRHRRCWTTEDADVCGRCHDTPVACGQSQIIGLLLTAEEATRNGPSGSSPVFSVMAEKPRQRPPSVPSTRRRESHQSSGTGAPHRPGKQDQ